MIDNNTPKREAPEVFEAPNADTNPEHQVHLFRWRVELYSAAQLFKGKDLEDLIQLIDEVALVAKSERQTALAQHETKEI